MDGCIVAEEFGYGCTGIKTALEASGLGVRNILYSIIYYIKNIYGIIIF